MRRTIVLLSASLIALAAGTASAQNAAPRNLILFVPDGLRGRIVTLQSAPTMAEVGPDGRHPVQDQFDRQQAVCQFASVDDEADRHQSRDEGADNEHHHGRRQSQPSADAGHQFDVAGSHES